MHNCTLELDVGEHRGIKSLEHSQSLDSQHSVDPLDELARLDAYIADQPGPVNRPTAIRNIMNEHLKCRSTKR